MLRSSVREFLCSEAMHHLGVPTTRALCLVLTGDQVVRDMFYDGNPEPEPGAIVCRVAPRFVRFGNFELPAYLGELDHSAPSRRVHDRRGLRAPPRRDHRRVATRRVGDRVVLRRGLRTHRRSDGALAGASASCTA